MNKLSVQREVEHAVLQTYSKGPLDPTGKSDWNGDLSPKKPKPCEVLQTLRETDISLKKPVEKDGSPSDDSLQSQLAQLKVVKDTSPGRLFAEHKPS